MSALRLLTHAVSVDGRRITDAGSPVMVVVDADGNLSVSPFSGLETHSTAFVNGLTEIVTDGHGKALSVRNGKRELLS